MSRICGGEEPQSGTYPRPTNYLCLLMNVWDFIVVRAERPFRLCRHRPGNIASWWSNYLQRHKELNIHINELRLKMKSWQQQRQVVEMEASGIQHLPD